MRYFLAEYFAVSVTFLLVILCQCDVSHPATATFNHSSASDEGLRPFLCNSSEDVFHCNESNCILKSSVCNGIPECNNGEDEHVKYCGCLPNEFRCTNSCIDILKRCDGKDDCENGEDEQSCETYSCPVTHFKCSNHKCISLDQYCDFLDHCGDNSDELNCVHRKCYFSEFTCKNGQCIRPGYVCDGNNDCIDGSDEVDCDESHFVECGDGSLVHHYYRCDGWLECSDNHADELYCEDCSGEDKFRCSNGRCIRQANVCDAHCDCVSDSIDYYNGTNRTCEDEQNCEEYYFVENGVKICKVGISLNCFVANDHQRKKDRCIRGEYICDGFNDCFNGEASSDEYHCNFSSTDLAAEDYFSCNDGRFLPTKVRCDYKIDCLSGEDEDDCDAEFRKCELGREPLCSNGECIRVTSLCDRNFDCFDKSDEMNCNNARCPYGWNRCQYGGQCIPERQWCDFYKDCPDDSDEDNCDIRECTRDEFRCHNGQCIDKSERCVNNGQIRSGCADGSHLLNCHEWVCDDDNYYKCYRGPCINRTLVCNGNLDCKSTWDDEDNCPFHCAVSDPLCECHDVHMNCTGLSLTSLPQNIEPAITRFHLGGNRLSNMLNSSTFIHLNRILFLDLSSNNIETLTPFTFQSLWKLSVLNLRNNKIRTLKNNTFFGLSSLNKLHLEHNRLQSLETMAFYGLSSLMTLDLHEQYIEKIEREAFQGLRSLTRLDLSWNRITYLEDGTFIGMPKLLYLDISKNRLRVVEVNVFKVTSGLQRLIMDEFRFCCLAKHVTSCTPARDEFSSCEDLMSNLILRICIWILGVIAMIANLFVIILRTFNKNANKVHSFLIKNLALGDFLMGMYLLIIAIVDWQYRGIYFIHDSEWRSSGMCSFAGFLSVFSSELSVFTLTVITLDRFFVIMFPFRTHRLEMKRTKLLMCFVWILAALISVLPLPFLRIIYFNNFYGRSGVCLPLHITPDKPNGWEYSVFVFLFLNLLSFMIIAGSYLWMYFVAKNTHRAVNPDRRTSESAMAFRMTLLVATDAACWTPIIGLGFISLAGVTVPPQVFAWVAVFVLPLNAALNPILYTLSTTPFMNPARKKMTSFRRTFSRNTRKDCCNSITVPYNQTNDCGTCEEILSASSRSNSVRWLQKVDTVVKERGETMPLRRLKSSVYAKSDDKFR